MNIKIMQENFAKALSFASKAVSSTPSIPILANVLIEAENKEVKLSTTDLEISISVKLGA